MVSNNIVETNPMAQGFIDETFDLLLKGLGIEDEDFESLEEILQEGLTDI
jgi:hypothetical protein